MDHNWCLQDRGGVIFKQLTCFFLLRHSECEVRSLFFKSVLFICKNLGRNSTFHQNFAFPLQNQALKVELVRARTIIARLRTLLQDLDAILGSNQAAITTADKAVVSAGGALFQNREQPEPKPALVEEFEILATEADDDDFVPETSSQLTESNGYASEDTDMSDWVVQDAEEEGMPSEARKWTPRPSSEYVCSDSKDRDLSDEAELFPGFEQVQDEAQVGVEDEEEEESSRSFLEPEDVQESAEDDGGEGYTPGEGQIRQYR